MSQEKNSNEKEIMLPVPQILQNPDLPNGCEITSCCEVLQFWGYPADKCELADHYLKRSEKWYGADPDQEYMGDPHREDESEECGFYCFAGPVVDAANRYINDFFKGFEDLEETARSLTDRAIPVRVHARDITGADQEELEKLLMEGCPFIFWASLHFEDIQYDERGGYYLPDGRFHRLFHQLHCMVCRGMDAEHFYIADPLGYNDQISKKQFMKIFRQLGSRAVVMKPS